MSRASSMRKFTRCLAAALTIGLLASPACYRAPTKTGSDQVYDPNIEMTALKDNALASKTWKVVDDHMKLILGNLEAPGCAVGIARGGELTYLQGYGKAKLGGENWGVGTMGAVGSVSKTFTAAGLLLMHQLGIVDVNQDVGNYAFSGNAALDNVAVAKLLNHTGGVGGGTKGAAFAPTWEPGSDAKACIDGAAINCVTVAKELAEPRLAYDQYSATEAVSALAPGQGVYSNVGYSVAGAIIDKLTAGTSYDGYEGWIWHRLGRYKPSELDVDNLLSLALTHSWRATDIPHRAVGYKPDGMGGYTPYEAFDLASVGGVEGWEGPAGGWAMTIGDLTRFTLALNTEKIVNNTMLSAMRFNWANLDDLSDDAGMGMLLGSAGKAPYWHGGQIGGHTAAWTWWDNSNGSSLAIALMCNRENLSPYTLRDVAGQLATKIVGSQPVSPVMPLLPVVELPNADGRNWSLDPTAAWQAAPTRALLPLTGLSHDLVLRAAVVEDRLSLTLIEADVSGSSARAVTGRTPTSLGTATVTRNPWFSTQPTDVSLASPLGDVVVRGLIVAGALDRDGAELSSVSLHGTLDARQVAPLFSRSATSLCAELATTGASCTPCADGSPTCLEFQYDGYAGDSVTMQ
jgi:CubicO group peptidase (beta-lactamase class C family)